MSGRPDGAIALALFAVSAASSVLLDAGLVCSNDGAHYALVRALGDDHTVVIDRQIAYTARIDYSERAGRLYSDRPPGTAFLALPFYLAARAAGAGEVGRQTATALVAALGGALAVALVFGLGRELGLSQAGAGAAALTLALATPLRTYASALFSHALSAGLVAAMAWLAARELSRPSRAARLAALGLLGGYAVVVDYSAALVTAVVGGTVAIAALRRGRGPGLRTLGLLGAAGALGVLPALVYHQIAFGSPFATAYRFHNLRYGGGVFANTRGLGSMYGSPFFGGFWGLLGSWRAGLLLYSPIFLAGLFALPAFAQRLGRARAAALLGPPLLVLLVTAKHITWHGGAPHDARYLVLVMPLLCLPVGEALDRLRGGARGPRWAGLLAFAGLFFLSALIQLVKHAVGWMRDPAPWIEALVRALPADPGPVARGFLGWLFPHPWAALWVLAAGLGGAALWIRRARAALDQGASAAEAAGGSSGATAMGSPTTR